MYTLYTHTLLDSHIHADTLHTQLTHTLTNTCSDTLTQTHTQYTHHNTHTHTFDTYTHNPV